MTSCVRERILIDGRHYHVDISRKRTEDPSAPRLVIAAHHTTAEAAALTRVAVRSMARLTQRPHEIWVVDNNSPRAHSEWLLDEPLVNTIFSRTEPIPPRKGPRLWGLLADIVRPRTQVMNRSYANGLALELAAAIIDPAAAIFGVFHNDVLACKMGWLEFMLSKFDDQVRGSAVATHNSPSGVESMSASGYLIDYQLARRLGAHFLPGMPDWDAAELPSQKIVAAGYRTYASENTFNHPDTVARIPNDHPLSALHADRSFDDAGDIYFMHLGRGTEKASGRYHRPGKTFPAQWIAYAEQNLLK